MFILKKLVITFVALLIVGLVIYQSVLVEDDSSSSSDPSTPASSDDPVSKPNEPNEDEERIPGEGGYWFEGVIEEIYDAGTGGIVDGEFGSTIVFLPEDEEWNIGDQVRVEYDGRIMESYPSQIFQYDIEKIEED